MIFFLTFIRGSFLCLVKTLPSHPPPPRSILSELAEVPGVAREKNRIFYSLCYPRVPMGSLKKCHPILSSRLAS